MECLRTLWTVGLFAAACNLDTLLLSMGYAARGVRISAGRSLTVAAVTTLVTGLSLLLGRAAAWKLPGGLTAALGGLVLVGIGAWFVLDWLRRPAGEAPPEQADPVEGLWSWISLAAALAVNNAGVGVAAGASGIGPLWGAAGNFLVTLGALLLGGWLGTGAVGRLLGRYALALSGVLLVLLGVWELLG